MAALVGKGQLDYGSGTLWSTYIVLLYYSILF